MIFVAGTSVTRVRSLLADSFVRIVDTSVARLVISWLALIFSYIAVSNSFKSLCYLLFKREKALYTSLPTLIARS